LEVFKLLIYGIEGKDYSLFRFIKVNVGTSFPLLIQMIWNKLILILKE